MGELVLLHLSLSGLTRIGNGSLQLSFLFDLSVNNVLSIHRSTRSALELLRFHLVRLSLDLLRLLIVNVNTHSYSFVTTGLSNMLGLFGTYR